MKKLVYKTALITLGGLVGLALLVFSLWILISPQTMADACEKTGNYSFAVTCADLRYKYSGNASDLARCAEDSILSGRDKLIVEYGAKLLGDENFTELCRQKDEDILKTEYGSYTSSYKSYICGHVAAAQYKSGQTDGAIETVKKDTSGQSLVKLVIAVSENSDREAAEKLIEVLKNSEQNELIIKLTEILRKI